MLNELIVRLLAPDRIVNLKTMLWKMYQLMMDLLPRTALFVTQVRVGPLWYARSYRGPMAELKHRLVHWKKLYLQLHLEIVLMKLK